MKRYGKKITKRFLNCMILFAALLYSGWLCFSGIRNAVSQQVQHFLRCQAQDVALLVLNEKEESTFVYLRRDANNDITAVSVNGVLLSQLQIQYQKALEASSAHCNLDLRLSDVLGSDLFSWLPGRFTASYRMKPNWNTSVVSRTIKHDENTTQFQVLLIAKGTANACAWFDADICEELILFETMLYAGGT